MIRYLNNDEKDKGRILWGEAFPEDSASFCDFYFQDKVKNNRILVKEEDGRLLSMLHLNPYRLKVRDRIWETDYIVGVATRSDSRHQGHMRDLLLRMLSDQYLEGRQFTFLMPADRRIYEPFQFAYIFDQPSWSLKDDRLLKRVYWTADQEQEGIAFLQEWMEGRYQVYAVRDHDYMKQFLAEVRSEDGRTELLYDIRDGRRILAGVQSVWGFHKKTQRELICREEYCRTIGSAKPAIMARIVNLQEFVKIFHLNEDCGTDKIERYLRVSDPLIAENNGCFCWHLSREGSRLERCQDTQGAVEVTIEQLAQWLFGYEKPGIDAGNLFDQINCLQGIFLDEVV